MQKVDRPQLTVAPLGRRWPHGTVALIDRASIAVAELAIGPQGVRVRRHVVAFNGKADLRYLDSDPASVVAVLARVLREHGFSPRLACVGLFESMFGATLCELPRTTAAATAALLERRVREQILDPSEDILADHASVDSATSSSAIPLRAMLAFCSCAQMKSYAEAFKREGLRVKRVVPPSVALLDLFGRTRPDDPDRLELFARYCFPSLVIGVNRGRQPLYLRFLPDLMADADDGVVPTLINEVRRTATFVAESHQGQSLAGVVYSGLSANDAARFVQRLAAEAGLAAQAQSVQTDGPDQGADVERLAALTGLLLHGAPMPRLRVRSMNMLPMEVRRLSRTVSILLALAVVSVVAAFSSLAFAKHEVRATTNAVRTLEARLAELDVDAPDRRSLLSTVQLAQAQQATLELLSTLPGNPVRPLLETWLLLPAGAMPADSRFDNAYAVGVEAPRLDLRLRGDFSGPGAVHLDALAAGLKRRPWCAELALARGDVKVSAQGVGAAEDVSLGMQLR